MRLRVDVSGHVPYTTSDTTVRRDGPVPKIIENPWRGTGLMAETAKPLEDAAPVAKLLAECPAHGVTPLVASPELAALSGVAEVWVKDERTRMGLGSFKALGAAYAIARLAAQTPDRRLPDQTFVTASAGNHGLSVAAGACVFGAKAVIFVAETVPQSFVDRLEGYGAKVVREGAIYEDSMAAAAQMADDEGWSLLSDSTWDGYTEPALRVMEGYTQMAAEAVEQLDGAPTHILLQAGVGGMAAAVAAHARRAWGQEPTIIVVEPEAAPALAESIRAGQPVTASGPVSAMGRLDCKTPSWVGLAGLSRDADRFATITEEEAETGITTLASHGFATSPSGGAALAALLMGLDLPSDARVLGFLSEGPEDAAPA